MKQNDRKLAAIMFTDIVGFSSLMTENESAALDLLKQKDSLLKPLIQKYNGQFVKNIGDGSLSYFNSAIDAVECATELQQTIQKKSKITIRVGVHLGDIILENNDIYGEGVNIASRLESMAVPGSILISKDIYDQISNHVEFDAVSLGLQALKGVGRLIEVYSVKGKMINVPNTNMYIDNTVEVHKQVDGTPSIAIIPFKNTGDKDDDFYSYGISAGIIQTCNQAGIIRVESIENVKKIKKCDSMSPQDLANMLAVRYIVTGSMLKKEDVFIVSIEVYDNNFSRVIWSDVFNENWHNLSKIKFKISEGILKTLDNDHLEYNSVDSIDSRSYEYYLKGKYKYSKRQNSEDTEIARSMFKKSIKLDAKLIDAKLWLGTTYTETGDYNKAMEIFKEGIFVAERLNNERAKGMAYDCIGNIHWHKGRYDKSLENLYLSLDIMNELNDQSGMAKSLHHIGHNYYYKGDLEKALSYYNRSIEIIEKLDDRNSMGHALLSLGNIYEAKNNIDKALSCYNQSYSISEMNNDKYASGYAQMGIGNIYTKMKKFDKAIDCYEKSLETRKEIDDINGMAHLHHNFGVTYKKMYDFKNAIKSFEKSLELSIKLEDQYSTATTHKNIAEIYRITGEYDKSLDTHFKSLKIRESINHSGGVVESLNCIGLVYYMMNDHENSMINLNKVNEIEFEDGEQVAINKLYLALYAEETNQKINDKEILSAFNKLDEPGYEVYYFLYKISNNSGYIKLAYNQIEKISDTIRGDSSFKKYPIPSIILNIANKN